MAGVLRQVIGLRSTNAIAEVTRSAPLHFHPHWRSPSQLYVGSYGVNVRMFPGLGHRNPSILPMASPESQRIVPSGEDEDGVSLGTMKLPSDTDIQRFEALLFQWANSLCQGANLPLPVPLKVDMESLGMQVIELSGNGTFKVFPQAEIPLNSMQLVDKIPGGARLGFVTIGDGETEVLVYIDCLVFPATESSAPIFRAVRNGQRKDQPPPGEPRIMKSLLQALKKSVEIARL